MSIATGLLKYPEREEDRGHLVKTHYIVPITLFPPPPASEVALATTDVHQPHP